MVSYETVRQWARKFGSRYAKTLKRQQGRLGDTRNLDGADGMDGMTE